MGSRNPKTIDRIDREDIVGSRKPAEQRILERSIALSAFRRRPATVGACSMTRMLPNIQLPAEQHFSAATVDTAGNLPLSVAPLEHRPPIIYYRVHGRSTKVFCRPSSSVARMPQTNVVSLSLSSTAGPRGA